MLCGANGCLNRRGVKELASPTVSRRTLSRASKQHLSQAFCYILLPARGATAHPVPATSRPAHAHVRTVHVSVQFSSGQSRIPTVTAEWPGCRCLAEPPPLTCFDSTRAAIADVSTPTPWLTRPGLSRATPFNAARLDAPLPLSPLPLSPRRRGLAEVSTPGSRPQLVCIYTVRPAPSRGSQLELRDTVARRNSSYCSRRP